MVHRLFRPGVSLALGQFSPGSFWPYVSGRLIEIARYIICNRVMALVRFSLIFILLLDIKMLTIFPIFNIYEDIMP